MLSNSVFFFRVDISGNGRQLTWTGPTTSIRDGLSPAFGRVELPLVFDASFAKKFGIDGRFDMSFNIPQNVQSRTKPSERFKSHSWGTNSPNVLSIITESLEMILV